MAMEGSKPVVGREFELGRVGLSGGVQTNQTNLDGQDLIAVQSSQRREARGPLEDKHGNSR